MDTLVPLPDLVIVGKLFPIFGSESFNANSSLYNFLKKLVGEVQKKLARKLLKFHENFKQICNLIKFGST